MKTPIKQTIESFITLLLDETKLTEEEIIQNVSGVLNISPSKVVDVISKMDF